MCEGLLFCVHSTATPHTNSTTVVCRSAEPPSILPVHTTRQKKAEREERLEQANVTSDDQVMKVTAHATPKSGTAKTVYRTHWSRPYTLTERKRNKDGKLVTTEKKVYTTDETYKKLITFRDGKEKADEYKAKHSRAKFVD